MQEKISEENIFRDYTVGRIQDDGFNVGSGNKITVANATLDATYEFRENLFFDISLQQRAYKMENVPVQKSTFFTAGVRLNTNKRRYDY